MSIKSTHHISRHTALSIIEAKLNEADDDMLAEILLAFPESEYRNYIVQEKLDKSDTPQITDIYDFNDRHFRYED